MSRLPDRLPALAGFLFAGGVLLQNGILLQGNPLPSAPIPAIQAFYAERSGAVGLAVGWVAVNVPLLLTFGAGVSARLERHPAAAVFGRVGFAGLVLLAAAFGSTTWLQAVLAARAPQLAAAGQLELVWDLHSAAFAGSGTALCVTLAAFSLGAWTEGLVPRWTAALGLLGAASLLGSGLLAVGTLDGGVGIYLQLAGFAAWVVWLLTASVRLWAGRPPPGHAAAQPAVSPSS